MKRTRKALISILLAILMISNSIIPTLPTMTVYAAATNMDGSSNSTTNPPQSIVGKTEIATWSYASAAQITAAAPSFQATSGYYQNTPDGSKSTLKLFKSNTQCTSGFGYSTSTISNNSYHGQADQGYWLIKTSTKGFKDLIFNFNSRSSGTGPRDFNTEWSTDGTNWNVFGNTTASTGYTVKIETTNPAEHFGMVLPTEASNQDTIYVRIIQKSNMSEGGVNPVASGGTHGINNIQLYGSKDPLYSTPNVTASPGTSDAILDVTPITLSCADSAAQIYYTTDGTTPMIAVSGSAIAVSGSAIAVSGSAIAVSGSAILYTGPFTALSQGGFTANDPFVIKAIAVSPSHLPSDVQTFSYTQQSVISNSDAKNLPANTYVWVKGVGTYLNGNTTLYIQDGMSPGSGICIYKSGANFSSYVGKEIYVHGKTSLYNGLMEIVPDTVDTANIIVRNETPTLPTPTKIMLSQLSDRSFEGMLVSLDTIKLNTVAGTTTSTYYNHTISQGGTPNVLRAKGIATTVGTAGSYVNITKAIVNYNSAAPYNGTYLFSANTAELVHTATPTVNFITASVTSGTSVPLNSVVTLSTATNGATITYRLNGGSPVTSTGNSVDVTVAAFTSNKATITATASDGSYTTAPQTFTYTQSQVADVTASPSSLSISATTPIVLTSASTGAQIVYSLYKNSYSDTDGVLVGSADQIYSKPITVDASFFPIRIVAKATLANYLDSKYSTFKYKAAKATGGEKNYYGSIHAHTAENSDGQGTLAEADAYARDVGKFDFFILTDHSNSFDKAPASDNLATIKDLNSYNTTNQQWINGKTEAAKATTDKFLCDYGYEMTWSGGPGHMNTFNTAGFVSRNNTLLNNKTNDAGMQAYYQLLKDTPGSITQFNHPGATFGNFSDFAYYDPAIDARVNLLEVGNGEGAVGSGGYFPSIDQYILALDKGWHLAPTNNGDNHKKGWGTSNTCATVVYTNDFTLSGIYQAMQDRSVWATENRDLDVTYHLTDGTNTYSMGAILDAPPAKADITITAKNKNNAAPTSNISSIQLISSGGKVVNKQTYDAGSSDITYTYSITAPQAGYYFAIITDNQGFHAVTAPIWLGSAPKAGITSVVNSTIMPVTTEALSLTTTLFNNESTPATLKSISYTVEGDMAASGTFTPGTNIASLGNATHVFHYTPATPGTKNITISAVITVGGTDITCSTTTTMKVLDINSVSYVGLDASHGNEYVSGGSYPNTMANMMTLAAKNGLRVVPLNSSEDLINACSNPKYKIMILNAPSRKSVTAWNNPTNYSANEIAALKTFSENGNTLVFGTIADYAESSNKDSATPPKHMSELQNSVLAAIGSTLREGDDEVMDDATNGGQPYRLYPTEFNLSNPLLQGVVSGQTYSQYSGATIYAVDPVTGERTTTLPSTVSALVYGFPTTYSAECDNDNFGYGTTKPTFPYVTVGSNKTDKGLMNADGIYIPKYVNPNSNIAVKPEEKLLAASEYVQHSNGKASLVVVAGGSFMSNFEIAVTMENTATLPYVNYNLMDNIYKTANPETITSIADAKKLADGTEVILEGTATSGVNTQNADANTNKGFFDCIYAQDSTGGINLFPVASGIEEGQKARFYGRITHYQGEIELTVTKFKVIDQTIHKITPTTMTTKVSVSPINTGALVKTSGVVSNVLKDADGTINQFTLDDGSGPAIIFINGYITKETRLPFIKNGAKVSVVGLASIGEVVSDSDMHARIRVRDRAEIVDLTAGTKTITIFHTNDMHGRLMDVYNSSTPKTLTTIGSDYVTAIKKSVTGSILIDAGDATQGLPFSTVSKGADVIKMMNAAGYDGMVAGNHEFDYGQEALIANAELAKFPVISANVIKSGKPLLTNINDSNGADFIKEVDGIKIGFFGITTQETEYKTNPANIKGISFADPIATAQAEVDKLKAQGAKVIVGILHIGNDSSSTITSSDIAKNVTGIDVIIDGHSHTIENNTVSNTLIAQTGSNSTNVGKIEIVMDSKGIVSKASSLLSAKYIQDNYSKDTEVAALANQINASQQPIFEKVVGYTDTTLWGGTVNGQSVGRLAETNLGDLVADAMRAFAVSQLEGTSYQNVPVISLENGGGIRDTIPAGNVTQGQVITILPFGNILSIKEANPKILYQVFENGFSKITGQNQSTGVITGADGRFPQIAGARVEYDPTLPSGERVKAIYLKGSNTALDKNDTTTKIILTSNDFEVAGGDGYTMLSALKNIGEGNALDVIVAQYITKLTQEGGGHFSYPPNDNRVKAVSSYVYTPYKTAITVSKASGILANSRVRYRIDNGTLHSATTDANGVLTIADIPSGVHSVRISNNDITGDIYINDIIGAGTYTKVTANLITPIDAKEAAANAVNTAIENLPGVNMVQLTDDASINAANKAYNALTLAQKNYITSENAQKLADVMAKLAQLKNNNSGGNTSGGDTSAAEKAAAEKAAAEKADKSTVKIDLSKEDFSDVTKPKTIAIKSDEIFTELKSKDTQKVNVSLSLPKNAISNTELDLVLKADVFSTLKETGKDLTVSVKDDKDKELYAWTFDKDELNNSKQKIADVNLSLKVSSIDTNSELSDMLKQKSEKGLIISFSNDGVLPAKASVRVYVGDQEGIKPGNSIYLYHYDKETGKLLTLPYSSNYMVDQDGYITIDILHCSEYVILKERAAASLVTPLIDQISVTAKKSTLHIGTKPSLTTMAVILPSTLELVKSMKNKTSQSGIGGVTAAYKSTNSKVAVIDKNGKITAKGVGKATILTTITLYNGNTKVIKTNITVKP